MGSAGLSEILVDSLLHTDADFPCLPHNFVSGQTHLVFFGMIQESYE